jgi:hypothetical protein
MSKGQVTKYTIFVTISRYNNFTSQQGHFPNFSIQKPKKMETLKNAFSKIVLDIFCQSIAT